ncbi:protein ALP1-like [Gymnodraco acuticeps]|uniref:Protein ALP1-like n=1 Tax=Gymnodraco acuticeps TaxID=8218 RepID=A0A6P8TP29_GYMAC|nr:protein ALP1-like [Gymnodraco acuticeps]
MFRAALALSAIAVLLVEDILKQQSLKKRKRRIRRNHTKLVKSWILQREAHGAFPNLCRELEFNEVPDFRNFARLFPVQFHTLEELITPITQRENTNYPDCISVGTRLMVTLRFLATGESFRSLSYQFRVGVSTIRQFVPETCTAIYEVLKEKYLKCPDTVEEWQQVADGFQAQWDFPNCLGALDGKHINIRPPPGTGSTYFNYKHTFSIVLKALVDSNYKFLYVDVGCNGRISDGGVFGGCSLQDALENRTFNIPAPAPLPASDQAVCYHIVADEAFPLKEYLMKPYPNRRLAVEQRIFNYRLSRARRVVENAFGILANRFRVFLTTINIQDTAKVEAIVLACCALHNFLRTENCSVYMAGVVDQEGPDHGTVPGSWRQDHDLRQATLPPTTNNPARAKHHRDELCQYFNGIGAVSFQWDKI